MLVLDRIRSLDARGTLAAWIGGDVHWRLLWTTAWAAAIVPAALAWLGAGRGHPVVQAVVVPALVWASIASFVLLVAWRERVRRWAFARGVERVLGQVAAVGGDALERAGEGTAVRFTGRLRASVAAAGDTRFVVRRETFCRRGAPRLEIRERASSFRLVDERGREVEVDVARAVLLEGPRGALAWQLVDGDLVEVVGFKHSEGEAAGSGPYRATRARCALTAKDDRPLLLRPSARRPV